MWKNKTDLFFLINQPIFHISYLFISFFCLFMCLLRRDNMVYKDLTGTQVGEVDLHFTFWPKEGSIAWFVAVGPSVMLQEKEKNTMTYGWNKLIQHPYKGQKIYILTQKGKLGVTFLRSHISDTPFWCHIFNFGLLFRCMKRWSDYIQKWSWLLFISPLHLTSS